MAIIPISRGYPTTMAWQDRARNGKCPDWRLVSTAAWRSMYALTHCRKLVFCKTTPCGSAPAGVSGSATQWRWYFRTGESNASGNSIRLRCEAQILPTAGHPGDQRWRVVAGALNSDYRRMPAIVATQTADDIRSSSVILEGLAPNTAYACALEVEDYMRVIALTVWEEVPMDADSAATYVSGQYQTIGNGLDVTDAQHTEFALDPFTVWKHNGAHYFSIVPDTHETPWTTSSTSYVNMLDATASTTVSSSTPGVNVAAQYHNPVHTDNVAAVFAVYGASSANTGDVILKNSGGTLGTLSNFSSAGEWKSVAVNLDGSAAQDKVDIQIKDTGGATLTVYSACLYAYES